MKFLLFLFIIGQFMAAGAWVGMRREGLKAKTALKLLSYFFVFHLALAFVLKGVPEVLDPRESSKELRPISEEEIGP